MNATCPVPQSQIEAYADGELEAQDTGSIAKHLEACAVCRQILAEHTEIKEAIRSGFRALIPEVDSPREWDAIAARLAFNPSPWQRIKNYITKPMVWAPSALATAAAAVIIFFISLAGEQDPTPLSQVESVSGSSSAEQVWVLQTAQTGQPLIWIQSEPKTEKEAG